MGRHLGATLLGLGAGAVGFVGIELAGFLLSSRVWGDSVTAFVAVAVVFGAAGLYAGWILGMVVFSAVRGSEDSGGGTG